jgi:hypothetical protein
VIDFRYHLVSIIAVFLALALGIVLGTTALNGVVLDDLRSRARSLAADNHNQVAQIDALQAALAQRSAFITRAEPALEQDVLTGQRVAVISAPGVPTSLRDGLRDALRRGGAVLTADVRLAPPFADPNQANALDDLATRLVVPGVTLPAKATGMELAAATLASVLVTRPGTKTPSPDAVQATLAGFQQAGFLSVAGTPGSTATLALLVVPPGPSSDDAAAKALDEAVTTMGVQLATEGVGVVLAGSQSAATDGLLTTVRKDRTVTARVSTVDSVDTAAGRIATVRALRSSASGRVGSYGFGPGAAAPLPSLAPSPAK